MTSTTIAGVLMVFSAATTTHFARLPRPYWAPWMSGPIGTLAALVGAACLFASAYAFIRESGWAMGLAWWIGASVVFATIPFVARGVFPALLFVSLVSGVAGLILVFVS